jgi:zinc protease
LPLDAGAQLIARLRQVTADQVKSVAQRYFGDDQLTVAILRPQPVDKATRAKPAGGAPASRH